MSENIEKDIIDYLERHSIATVATIDAETPERPHASAVEYVNVGLKLYFVSIPGTSKTRNLEANPAVALAVNDSWLDMRGVQGVQYFGRAKRVEDKAVHEEIAEMFYDKYTVFRKLNWNFSRAAFYELTPERVDFIDYKRKFGHKETWRPE